MHVRAALGGVVACLVAMPAQAAAPPYPAMAPIARYRMASVAAEIALARSAAPPAISEYAEIRVLGARGYDVAVKGTNGFVCLVQRSWANQFGDTEFWNPKDRSPLCVNPAAARSVLPEYFLRTSWVLAGDTRAQITTNAKAAVASKRITEPAVGAMAYMMSKDGYLNDDARGPWHPHVMFFLPPTADAQLGANIVDSAIYSATDPIEPITTVLVPIGKWSDGTPYIKRAKHIGTRASRLKGLRGRPDKVPGC